MPSLGLKLQLGRLHKLSFSMLFSNGFNEIVSSA